MVSVAAIGELLATIVREEDTQAALAAIIHRALALTGSRNCTLAILDDETGRLEVQHGEGPDWSLDRVGHEMDITIGRRSGITALVAATGETFVTGNVSEVSAYQTMFETTVSEMAVPIRDRYGFLRAVLNLESDRQSAYSEEAVDLAETIGHIASLVLERDEARNREDALVAIGTALDQAHDEDEILDLVTDVASQVLRLQACSIFLKEPNQEFFVLRASTGSFREYIGKFGYEPGEGVTGWVCSSGEPILLDHPQSDPRWRGKFTEIPSDDIASFLAVPIRIRGRTIGAIRLLRHKTENEYLDNRFSESDLRMLMAIGDQLGVALDGVRSMKKLIQAERMSAWGELSARTAHMIGNRVFALRGDVNELRYLVGQEDLDRGGLQSLQEGIETNIMRLQELLQDYRDFVTATQIVKHPGDLFLLAEQTAKEVFPHRSDIELQVKKLDDIPSIEFDPQKLRLAIAEIIENAVTFLDKGVLSVSVGYAVQEDLNRIRSNIRGRFVKVDIEDTGPGVPADIKDKIFNPFFSTRARGMGLGLSIVKGIIDAHGGTVAEVGIEGRGAKFLVLLPVPERPNPKER